MKKPFIITYDLNSPGQKYDEVIKVIKNDISVSWCKYWESAFLFTSNLNPNQMLDKLKPYLDKGDRMIILEVTNNKNGWLTQEQWNWINKNIF